MQLLISAAEIQKKIIEVAHLIDAEYTGEELTIVMVMKGAFCFTADLIRVLQVPTSIEYIQASSYGRLGVNRGELVIHGLENLEIAGKNVLIIDDIFDSGHTLSKIIDAVQSKQPKTLKTLVLLSKKIDRTVLYYPDHVLF